MFLDRARKTEVNVSVISEPIESLSILYDYDTLSVLFILLCFAFHIVPI